MKEKQGMLSKDTAMHARVPKTQVGVHKVSADKTHRKFPSCYRCKGQHIAPECKFATELCHNCGKRGHIKKVCRLKMGNSHAQKATLKGQKGENRGPGKEQRANQLRGDGESDTEDMDFHTIYSMSEELTKVAPITRTNVEESRPSRTKALLTKSKNAYTGEKLEVLGMAQVKVQHENKEPVVVLGGEGPNLTAKKNQLVFFGLK